MMGAIKTKFPGIDLEQKEDLAMEALLRGLKTANRSEHPVTYMCHVAVNVTIDFLRRKHFECTSLERTDWGHTEWYGRNTVMQCSYKEALEDVKAIDVHSQVCLKMFLDSGNVKYSYAEYLYDDQYEAAKAMGLTYSAFKTRLFRERRNLNRLRANGVLTL